jgi:hypothetical protein
VRATSPISAFRAGIDMVETRFETGLYERVHTWGTLSPKSVRVCRPDGGARRG